MCFTVLQASAEMVFDFAIKNSFCAIALDQMRTHLQDLISKIALPHLGSFVAPFVGTQLGLLAAMPITLFFGDVIAQGIKELAYSVYDCALRFFAPAKRVIPPSVLLDTVLRVGSFVVGFFAKIAFYSLGMVAVGNVLRLAMIYGGPLMNLPMPAILALPALITLATPTVTFIVGDLLGSTVRQIFYDKVSSLV